MGFNFNQIKEKKENKTINNIRQCYLDELEKNKIAWYDILKYNNPHTADNIIEAFHISINNNLEISYSMDIIPNILLDKTQKIYLIDPNFIQYYSAAKSIFKCSDNTCTTAIICAYGNVENNYRASYKFIKKLYNIDIIADTIIFQLSYESDYDLIKLYDWIVYDSKKHPDRTYIFVNDTYTFRKYFVYPDIDIFNLNLAKSFNIYERTIKKVVKNAMLLKHTSNNIFKRIKMVFHLIKIPNIKFINNYIIASAPYY